MTLRGFLVMALLAGFALTGAVVTVITEPGSGTIVQAETPAFPALRADPDAVARVVVDGEDGRIELERRGADWIATNKHDYPANPRKLRRLIVRLSDMHLTAAKTKRPELHYRIEVEGPDAPNTKSHGLRLEDAQGNTILDAVFGQRHWRRTGAARNGIYFRHAGDDQAWLAGGGYSLDGGLIAWLETVIVDLRADQVRSVVVAPAGASSDGEGAYGIARDSAEASFTLTAEQADAAAASDADPATLNRLAEALQDAKLKDVVPAADQPWPPGAARTRFATFDGREIAVETATIEGKTWLRLIESRAPDGGAATDETGETARQAAEALAARTAGWSYEISPHLADRLTPPLAALTAGDGS